MTKILAIKGINSILNQIVTKDANSSPHTSMLLTKNGSILLSNYLEAKLPFPKLTLLSDKTEEDRSKIYSAVAITYWNKERNQQQQQQHLDLSGEINKQLVIGSEEPLLLETELGRIAMISIGDFFLVLVGSEVAPWSVLSKKITLAGECLRKPLEQVTN